MKIQISEHFTTKKLIVFVLPSIFMMIITSIYGVIVEIGYTIGCAPIIAYNYGSENHLELKSLFKKSVITMSIVGIILSGLAQALAIPLAKLFVGYNEELYTLTVYAFRLFSFSFIFSGINIFSSGFFTALNNGIISAIISFLHGLIFQVAFVFILPLIFGVDGICWAMFATEICACIVSVSFFIAERKNIITHNKNYSTLFLLNNFFAIDFLFILCYSNI